MSEPSDKSEAADPGMTRRVGPRPPDELAYESVARLAARIRRRELSPVEVLDHFIARIEALDSKLNSVVVREFDEARERARAAEQKVRSGSNLGPLHGVPLALKDLFGFKPGWRNTFGGVRALKDYVAKSWSMFPERIEQAGAIILGQIHFRASEPSAVLQAIQSRVKSRPRRPTGRRVAPQEAICCCLG